MLYLFKLNNLSPRLKWHRNRRQFKDLSKVALGLIPETGEHLPRVTFYCWIIFVFHVVRPLMSILSFLCICMILDECVCNTFKVRTSTSNFPFFSIKRILCDEMLTASKTTLAPVAKFLMLLPATQFFVIVTF